ncbi:hypothetical protein BDZ89DRAFT_511389 [Hymenopellis radicata]|nr:hypothetical protein BDZ89DRAFT_511389 [Hymenopellis radicata]
MYLPRAVYHPFRLPSLQCYIAASREHSLSLCAHKTFLLLSGAGRQFISPSSAPQFLLIVFGTLAFGIHAFTLPTLLVYTCSHIYVWNHACEAGHRECKNRKRR